jgi:oligosaccharide repeat unit polymerase
LVDNYTTLAHFTYAVKVGREMVGSYFAREIASAATLVCFYGMFMHAKRIRQDAKGRRIHPKYLLLFACLISINLFVISLWSTRIVLAILTIIMVISWHFFIRKLNLFKSGVFSALFIALLVELRDLRFSNVSEVVGRKVGGKMDFWTDLSTSLHFAEFDALMLTIRDTGTRIPFRYGEDFLNGLIGLVPSFIYKTKENHYIGQWFRQVYEPSKINGWPITTPGEWYINFNWPGLILGALVTGFLASSIDKRYATPRSNPWHLVAAGAFSGFSMSGGFWTGTPQKLAIYLGVFWMLYLFTKLIEQRSARTRYSPRLRGAAVPKRLRH